MANLTKGLDYKYFKYDSKNDYYLQLCTSYKFINQ